MKCLLARCQNSLSTPGERGAACAVRVNILAPSYCSWIVHPVAGSVHHHLPSWFRYRHCGGFAETTHAAMVRTSVQQRETCGIPLDQIHLHTTTSACCYPVGGFFSLFDVVHRWMIYLGLGLFNKLPPHLTQAVFLAPCTCHQHCSPARARGHEREM